MAGQARSVSHAAVSAVFGAAPGAAAAPAASAPAAPAAAAPADVAPADAPAVASVPAGATGRPHGRRRRSRRRRAAGRSGARGGRSRRARPRSVPALHARPAAGDARERDPDAAAALRAAAAAARRAWCSSCKPPRAMLQDNSGMGYIVTPGTPIGRRRGVVKSIEPRRIVVEEHVIDYYGREQTHAGRHRDGQGRQASERRPGVTMMRVASGLGAVLRGLPVACAAAALVGVCAAAGRAGRVDAAPECRW